MVIILAAVVAGAILTLSAIALFLHCRRISINNYQGDEKESKTNTGTEDSEEDGLDGGSEDEWEGTDSLSDQFTNLGDTHYNDRHMVSCILFGRTAKSS